MRAKLDDVVLFFDVDGLSVRPEGAEILERPTAFMVHGGPGTDHVGQKLRYGPLTARLQLVYFDHRGHGRSDRADPSTYTLDQNVKDMEALRRHLGLGPIISIGAGYGGMVAMAHAARYPAAVSHLIPCVTAAHGGYIARALANVAERGSPAQIAIAKALFAGELDTAEKTLDFYRLAGPLFARSFRPGAHSTLKGAIIAPEPQNRAFGAGGHLNALDLRPELSQITAKTLIIAGRHDWMFPPEFSEEMHRLIDGARLEIFENSGHMVVVDEPERVLDLILDFVSGDVPTKVVPNGD
jgi:proline iminopeptidase